MAGNLAAGMYQRAVNSSAQLQFLSLSPGYGRLGYLSIWRSRCRILYLTNALICFRVVKKNVNNILKKDNKCQIAVKQIN